MVLSVLFVVCMPSTLRNPGPPVKDFMAPKTILDIP